MRSELQRSRIYSPLCHSTFYHAGTCYEEAQQEKVFKIHRIEPKLQITMEIAVAFLILFIASLPVVSLASQRILSNFVFMCGTWPFMKVI